MAYANKYKITYATRGGKTAYLYLQEDGYLGSLIEYQGVDLQLQYLPQSDDPFEPIYASQLNVSINITDNMSAMPDFTTNNDRKYFAKLFLDSDLQWVGYSLSDSVTLNYSTGNKELSFNCTDGLGMLESIPLYATNEQDINVNKTLLYYFITVLNTLSFPSNPNIFTSCNYYGLGMQTRTDGSQYEPFNQTYLPVRTFYNSDYTFMNGLTILREILSSFGCRIYMANGKWNIISINQFANDIIYYTEYDYIGSVVSSGTTNTKSVVQGYLGNTSNLYFIDNSQTKIMRKGYNKVNLQIDCQPCANYISNGNLRPANGTNQCYNWTLNKFGLGSSFSIIDNTNQYSAQFRMLKGTEVGSYVEGVSTSYPQANIQDVITGSWDFYGQDLSNPIVCDVYLRVTDGTNTYYWSGVDWLLITSGPPYMPVPLADLKNQLGTSRYSFQTKPLPISGKISFKIRIDGNTGNFIQVGGFSLGVNLFLKSFHTYAYIVNNKQYVKDVNFPFGFQSYNINAPAERGVFLTNTGAELTGWYQFGRSSASYETLSQLLMQSYINIFGKNIINIDGSLMSYNTNNGILNPSKVIQLTDTDPTQINVANNYYMLGNSTIDFPSDSTKVTLLQISDLLIDATIWYDLTYNN